MLTKRLFHPGMPIVTTIDAPLQWVETVATLRLPEQADRQLQQLMDRNNEGQLSELERAELAAVAALSERLSLVRAEALHLLGRKPKSELLVAAEDDQGRQPT